MRFVALALLAFLAAGCRSDPAAWGYATIPEARPRILKIETFPPGSVRVSNAGQSVVAVELLDPEARVEARVELKRGESETWSLGGVLRYLRLTAASLGGRIEYSIDARDGVRVDNSWGAGADLPGAPPAP